MPRAYKARGIRFSRRRTIRPAGRTHPAPPPPGPDAAERHPSTRFARNRIRGTARGEQKTGGHPRPNGSGRASRPLKTRKKRNPEKARLRKNAGGGENENPLCNAEGVMRGLKRSIVLKYSCLCTMFIFCKMCC